jgi:transcriptional regulator with XRE-family HTH domain
MPKNKKLKEIVGENVKAIMAAKKLSQPKVAAMAKKSGTPVDQTTVGRVARADFPATVDTLEAIANGCGVPSWQLLIPSGTDVGILELLRAWEQSGDQGKELLSLAAKGALQRESFEATDSGAADRASSIAQPRRNRSG